MNKYFKNYLIIWAILLVLFNVIAFTFVLAGVGSFNMSFFLVYFYTLVAFLVQLVVMYYGTKNITKEKLFYNMSYIELSYTMLIIMLLFSSVYLFFTKWFILLISCIILAIYTIKIIKAYTAVDIVSNIDNKVKEKTSFIKNITIDIETLVKNNKEITELKELYELVRYSNPVSNENVLNIEQEIKLNIDKLEELIENKKDIKEISNNIKKLINKRNNELKK